MAANDVLEDEAVDDLVWIAAPGGAAVSDADESGSSGASSSASDGSSSDEDPSCSRWALHCQGKYSK